MTSTQARDEPDEIVERSRDSRGRRRWLEKWSEGSPHRPGGPTEVYFQEGADGTSVVTTERWFHTGSSGPYYHREDGPASITYDDTGAPEDVRYYLHGEPHREGGPAVTEYDGSTYYYRHGKLHRDDGPSVTRLSKDHRAFHLDGEVHSPSAYLAAIGRPLPPGVDADKVDRIGYDPEVADFMRFVEAVESGAPIEWAIAFAEGSDG